MSVTELVKSNGTSMAVGQNAPVPYHVDRDAVMAYLKMNPRDPATQAHLLVCERYGLDALLKHVVLIPSGGTTNLFITRDGLLHIAHRSGMFDGMDTCTLPDSETHFIAQCTVYRKDMTRGFTFSGRYPKNGQNRQYGPEMAEKVAVSRSLRHAFDVSIGTREEMWDAPTTTDAADLEAQRIEARQAKQHLIALKQAFLDEADRLGGGANLRDADGKPSGNMMAAFLEELLRSNDVPGVDRANFTAQDWENGTRFMSDYLTPYVEETAAAPVVTADNPDSDLTDPFAEEAEAEAAAIAKGAF